MGLQYRPRPPSGEGWHGTNRVRDGFNLPLKFADTIWPDGFDPVAAEVIIM